jgi:hypothetical protein
MNEAIDAGDAFVLATMVQVIGEAPRLLEKANILYRTPLYQRNLVLQGIVKHMMDAKEDADIVKTFQLLAIPSVYMGAMEALHDGGYLER